MAFFGALVEIYQSQFEWEGGQLIFRRNGSGPGYKVSEVEMIEATDSYRQRMILGFAATMVVTVFAAGLAFYLAPLEQKPYWMLGAIVAGACSNVLPHRWAFNGPTRRFLDRVPIGSIRTRGQRIDQALSEFGWTEAIFFLLFGAAALLKMDHFPPQGVDWLAFSPLAMILGFLCWVAWRKRARI